MPFHSMNDRAGRMLILGLALLLGVQLTGLNCLGESTGIPIQAEHVALQPLSSACSGGHAIIDDGCPCHLIFVSAPMTLQQASEPFIYVASAIPEHLSSRDLPLPFHPPISL